MDDLKLFGKTKSDLESHVPTVLIYTKDVRMRFGLQKCVKYDYEVGEEGREFWYMNV